MDGQPNFASEVIIIANVLNYLDFSKVEVVQVRIAERNTEYSGLFFIRKGLIEKTRNYDLRSKDDGKKVEMFDHLKGLNVDSASLEELDDIISTVFDSNNGKVSVEVLLIDYGDRITVNMKDEGKEM